MTQFELNKQLYEAVTAPKIDFLHIENLLKLGADPLGSDDELDKNIHIIADLRVITSCPSPSCVVTPCFASSAGVTRTLGDTV